MKVSGGCLAHETSRSARHIILFGHRYLDQAFFSFLFFWPERSGGKSSTERRRGKDLLLKGLWVLLNITLLGFYVVMANPLINWFATQLRVLSTLLVLLFVSLVYLWSIMSVVEALMAFSIWGNSKGARDFLRWAFFIGIGKNLFPFPLCFISFAHLSRELSCQGYAVFQDASAEIGPWIRYAIEMGIDSINSDILSILKIELSTIVSVSMLARGSELFFCLFIKFIFLATILKILYLYIKKRQTVPEPPGSSVDEITSP